MRWCENQSPCRCTCMCRRETLRKHLLQNIFPAGIQRLLYTWKPVSCKEVLCVSFLFGLRIFEPFLKGLLVSPAMRMSDQSTQYYRNISANPPEIGGTSKNFQGANFCLRPFLLTSETEFWISWGKATTKLTQKFYPSWWFQPL